MVADHILQTDSSPHNPLTSNEIGFRKFGNVSTLDSLISVDGCFTETHSLWIYRIQEDIRYIASDTVSVVSPSVP